MASDTKDPKNPATTSFAYDEMAPRWAVMDAVLGGTEKLRAAGREFLPQHEEETDESYAARLSSTVFLNMAEQTLEALSSKPFGEPPQLDDVPEQIEGEWLPNVDLQGNNLSVFVRTWFREGLAKAFCHVLVDMPRPIARPDGSPRTLDDDRQQGIRPYWVLIKPERVISAQSVVQDGREVLTHVRILEQTTETQGFAEVVVRRIRVLEPGTVTLYKPKEQKTGQREEWVIEDTWITGLDYIPLVTFYATREGTFCAKPPLLDLAYMNLAHWASASDQRHILRVARFPILACSGASEADSAPIVIGPNKVLYNPDPQGKFYYVEHQGHAIEAGRKDLEDLERQMSGYGAEFLTEDPGTQTATAKAIDSAEQSSSLANMVQRFEDAIAQALDMMADWGKINGGSGGTVTLCKDFTPDLPDAPGLDALDKARARRDLSRKAYLKGLMSRGVLPPDFDHEEDLEELQDEVGELVGATGIDLRKNGIDPTTGLPFEDPEDEEPPAKGKKPVTEPPEDEED